MPARRMAIQNPQPLPTRTTRVEADQPDALGGVQPERKRRYHQLQPGRFRGELTEVAWGGGALLFERWSCGLRVRCDRETGYVAYTIVDAMDADARWCGAPLAPGSLLRVEDPWDLLSAGHFEMVSFAVDQKRLREVATQLDGGRDSRAPRGNGLLRSTRTERVVKQLARLASVLQSPGVDDAAFAAAEAALLYLAASLERESAIEPVERLAPASTRRKVVRRVEEYLDSNQNGAPTIATLCGVAGVSERTLEYAFRVNLGTTPVRYLKLRRLNQYGAFSWIARRRPRPSPPSPHAQASMTSVASRRSTATCSASCRRRRGARESSKPDRSPRLRILHRRRPTSSISPRPQAGPPSKGFRPAQ